MAALFASLAAAVLVVVARVLLGEYTQTRGRLLLTALSLSGFCLLALPPSVVAQGARYRLAGCAGLAAAGLGCLLVIAGTWATPDSDAYWKAAGIVSIEAVSLSHLCWLLLLPPRVLASRVAWWIASGAASLVPLLAGIGIIAEIKAPQFWWAVVILIIAQLGGGISSVALNRWASRRSRLLTQGPRLPDELVCPRNSSDGRPA